MLIDWFTVAAQALNFLILVFLLRRFLYKPILSAVDARENRIATQLADAATKQAAAQKDGDDFQKKSDAFDLQRAGLLAKATEDAKTERERLLSDAGKAADVLSASRHDALLANAQSLNASITRRTQDQVFAISRKTLTDLAGISLEERMVNVFNRRLGELNGEAKQVLGAALTGGKEPAMLRSAFDLPPVQRASLQNAVNVTFSADIHLRYETAPDLISGIELAASGQKISWNIAEYLTSLEKGVDDLLTPANKVSTPATPKPSAPTDGDKKT